MKLLISEIVTLAVMLSSGYVLLLVSALSDMQAHQAVEQSFWDVYAELLIVLPIFVVSLVQMCLLPLDWKEKVKRRWAAVIILSFTPFLISIIYSLKSDRYFGFFESLVVLVQYLFLKWSWDEGFRELEEPSNPKWSALSSVGTEDDS